MENICEKWVPLVAMAALCCPSTTAGRRLPAGMLGSASGESDELFAVSGSVAQGGVLIFLARSRLDLTVALSKSAFNTSSELSLVAHS